MSPAQSRTTWRFTHGCGHSEPARRDNLTSRDINWIYENRARLAWTGDDDGRNYQAPSFRRRDGAEAAERRPRGGHPLEEVGTLPERAAVGHGARGLQPGRQRLGLLHPRPVPLARLPLGRGRPRRASRTTSSASALPSPCGTSATPSSRNALFGLTNSEANHGEDVKEYYFYVDSTPTHSYMKYLYKYPQREFPYRDLVETNRRPVAGGVRVRAARHRRLRRRPLLRRLRRVRQGRPGRHPDPDHRPQPRA